MEKTKEPTSYTPDDLCSFPVSIRPLNSPYTVLPVVKSTTKIWVIQEYVRVQCEYVIYNDQDYDITSPLFVLSKLPGAYSESVRFFKNTTDLAQTSTILKDKLEKKQLFDEKIEYIVNEPMVKGGNWTVHYVFFKQMTTEELKKVNDNECEVPTGTQRISFVLPTSFYQLILEGGQGHYDKIAPDVVNKLNYKFETAGDADKVLIAPWEISIEAFRSTFPSKYETNRGNSEPNYLSNNEGEDVFRNFELFYERTFQPEVFKYHILEKNETDNCYYLLLKTFPIQEMGFQESENVFVPVFNRTWMFTIVCDMGKEMTVPGRLDNVKEYAKQIIDTLPEDCKFRMVYLPDRKGQYDANQEYLENAEENREAAKKEIDEVCCKVLNEDSNISNYIEKIKDQEEDEYEPQRFIFIGGPKNDSNEGIKQALCGAVTEGKRKRFYYVSVSNGIEFGLAWNFFCYGSGAGLMTKDEMDIYDKAAWIMQSCTEPFMSSIKFQFENFDGSKEIKDKGVAISGDFNKKVRGIKNNIEYFAKIQDGGEVRIPSEFGMVISYEFDGSNGFNDFKFNTSNATIIKPGQDQYFLSQLFDLILETNFNNSKKTAGICGSANKKDDGGVVKYAFDIIYGTANLGERSYDAEMTFEAVREAILKDFPEIKNLNNDDWTTGGNKIDFSKKLVDLENEGLIFPSIDIKKVDTEGDAKISVLIANKFNKEKLFDFDAKLVTEKIKCSKDDWRIYEKALLANQSKFKGHLDSIGAGTSRNLAFSLFCVAYLKKKCANDSKDYDDKLKKVVANMKSFFGYDDQFQADAEACMGNLLN